MPCLRQVPVCPLRAGRPEPLTRAARGMGRGWTPPPWSRPSQAAPLGRAAQVPDCKAVPVSPVIRSHDTIPGSPHCVLLLLFLNIVGREVDVEREFREGSGVVKCAPANCSGSRPRIGRGLCRNTWRLSGQQREARPFRDVSTCPHLPPLAGK